MRIWKQPVHKPYIRTLLQQGTPGDWSDHRSEMGVEMTWTTVRLKANAVRTEIKKMIDQYDDIIIDCGGRNTSSLRHEVISIENTVYPQCR